MLTLAACIGRHSETRGQHTTYSELKAPSKMIGIQKIDFPLDCMIILHDFHNYDPVTSFNVENSLKYLNEDLLQCSFPLDDIIIDLGWYGDIVSNKGEFRIQVIQHENWDFPFNTIYSKSAEEVKSLLTKILQYYSRIRVKTELDTELS